MYQQDNEAEVYPLREERQESNLGNLVAEQVADRGELVPYVSKKSKRRSVYVKTPDVLLGEGSAKGVFLRADIARETALEILRVCDQNGL